MNLILVIDTYHQRMKTIRNPNMFSHILNCVSNEVHTIAHIISWYQGMSTRVEVPIYHYPLFCIFIVFSSFLIFIAGMHTCSMGIFWKKMANGPYFYLSVSDPMSTFERYKDP